MGNIKEDLEQLDWLKIKEEIGSTDVAFGETGSAKFVRKFKENPFVPIGAGATAACLLYGLYCFRRGEKRMSQMMMRARVIAQGFTLFAIVGGVAMTATKNLEKENKLIKK